MRLDRKGSSSWARLVGAALCVAIATAWLPPRSAFAAGVSPLTASAQERRKAQARYEEGAKLFEAKRFPEALKAFQESYDIVASPNSHLMIARSLRDSGKLVAAYEEFGRVE